VAAKGVLGDLNPLGDGSCRSLAERPCLGLRCRPWLSQRVASIDILA